MRKISILALTKSTGGIAFYNRMLLAELDGARFDTHTLCLSENGEVYARELAERGLSAEPVAMDRYRINLLGDFRVMRRALDLARERRIDVIVCHGSKSGVIGRAVGLVAGVPVIYRQASMPFLRRVQGAKAPLYWALEFAARVLGGHMVTLTELARRATLAHRLIAPKRVSVIRTGVDTERFRPRGRREAVLAEIGLDPARPVVGWLGRVEPQKAPDDYLSALEIVAPRHPDAQFVIAGDGRLKPEIASRLEASGLADRVVMLPWQSDSSRILEAFDIYALSSRWEGLPLTLLEAMACGCAPVSTDVDGCAEVIEDGISGSLVPAAAPEAMAAAIDALLASPERRVATSIAARRRVEDHFDKRRMVDNWTELLERLTSGRPAHDVAQTG